MFTHRCIKCLFTFLFIHMFWPLWFRFRTLFRSLLEPLNVKCCVFLNKKNPEKGPRCQPNRPRTGNQLINFFTPSHHDIPISRLLNMTIEIYGLFKVNLHFWTSSKFSDEGSLANLFGYGFLFSSMWVSWFVS